MTILWDIIELENLKDLFTDIKWRNCNSTWVTETEDHLIKMAFIIIKECLLNQIMENANWAINSNDIIFYWYDLRFLIIICAPCLYFKDNESNYLHSLTRFWFLLSLLYSLRFQLKDHYGFFSFPLNLIIFTCIYYYCSYYFIWFIYHR